MGLLCRGTLMDGGSILWHQHGMKNYSLIIEKQEASPSTPQSLLPIKCCTPHSLLLCHCPQCKRKDWQIRETLLLICIEPAYKNACTKAQRSWKNTYLQATWQKHFLSHSIHFSGKQHWRKIETLHAFECSNLFLTITLVQTTARSLPWTLLCCFIHNLALAPLDLVFRVI